VELEGRRVFTAEEVPSAKREGVSKPEEPAPITSRFDVHAEMAALPEVPAPLTESEMSEEPLASDPASRIAALIGREESDW
jgi:hypothetical protein